MRLSAHAVQSDAQATLIRARLKTPRGATISGIQRPRCLDLLPQIVRSSQGLQDKPSSEFYYSALALP